MEIDTQMKLQNRLLSWLLLSDKKQEQCSVVFKCNVLYLVLPIPVRENITSLLYFSFFDPVSMVTIIAAVC